MKLNLNQNTKEAWTKLLAECLRKLQESDWTQLPDAAITKSEKDHWKEYRRELRQIIKKQDKVCTTTIEFPPAPEQKTYNRARLELSIPSQN